MNNGNSSAQSTIRTYLAQPLPATAHIQAELGESPVWDETHKTFYWCDIIGEQVLCLDTVTNSIKSINTHAHVGFVAKDGHKLLLGLQTGLYDYHLADDSLHLILESTWPDDVRINDGKINPIDGSVWFGTVQYNLAPQGNLYRFAQGVLTPLIEGVTISNGLCWHKEYFYYIDSPTQKVMRYQYATDKISHPTDLCHINPQEGIPDGMCLDEKGWLWIALYDGGKVIAIDAASGERKAEVITPLCPKPTSCCFAVNEHGVRRLYITSAQENLDAQQRKTFSNAGIIMYVDI